MKRLIKNHIGFTLIEIMVSLGVTSLFVIVIMNAQRTSEKSMAGLKRNVEINEIFQVLTTELAKEESCTKTFQGHPLADNYTQIKDKMNHVIFKTGPFSPETTNGDNKYSVNVISMVTTVVPVSPGSPKRMNLTVTYKKMLKAWDKEVANANETFIIPINVGMNDADTLIDSCHSEYQSLFETAIQAACQGNASKYVAPDLVNFPNYPYGRCEHEIEMKSGATTISASGANGVFSCPPGEVLKNIDTTNGKMSFQCSTVSITNTCAAWEYLEGINANGTGTCKDVRTLFPNAGFMVVRNNVLEVQTLMCPAGRVLQRINSDGSLVCVNPRLSVNCPVNQYATGGINPDGTVTCGYAGDSACPGGYIKNIDAAGTVTCQYSVIPGSCGAGSVMNGIDASGNITCVAVPP